MFLKSLEIKGFKSFADGATLTLEPGVTVVVGPNGSGKSNVVDAIGWVLGAQAPSAVRSQKMDDVIFAGSAKRPALGRAEVSLTIDNSSGLLPIEFTEVTITRVLFRSGDSEYSLNGVPCRLLDIQELLSDSGVGRQQHVIISQGQIDAVLNAKPEDRRFVIEEAAGVLKFRRRKEKAERRIASTDANLTRVQDLLREVRRQLRPLERQADAARRHGSVAAELSALKLHRLGRELARHRTQLESSTAEQRTLRDTERGISTRLAALDASILEFEAQLSGLGGQEFGDALVRYESLRERARGLMAVLAERAKGIERARQSAVDSGVVASLEAEGAQLRAELEAVTAESAEVDPERERLSLAERDLEQARVRFESDWGGGLVAGTGAMAEARAEIAGLERAVERTEAERARAQAQRASLGEKAERISAEVGRLDSEAQALAGSADDVSGRVEAALTDRLRLEAELGEAVEHHDRAVAEHHRWQSRADALEVALDEARQRAGADRVAELDGVLGTVLDLVEVDAGFEQAFEAAASDVLGLIVVEQPAAARNALRALASEDLHGAVLSLGHQPSAATPIIGDALRSHVRATQPAADGLLDRLLDGVVVIDGGWEGALDAALAAPTLTHVTLAGDRFGQSGWRLTAGGAGATGAARDEARTRAEQAEVEQTTAAEALRSLRERATAAASLETEEVRGAEQHRLRLEATSSSHERAGSDLAETRSDDQGVTEHVTELDRRLEGERSRLSELAARLPALAAAEAERDEQEQMLGRARAELETRAASVGDLRTEVEVRVSALDERTNFLRDRISQVDTRLARNQAERAAAESKREALDRRMSSVVGLSSFVASRLEQIESVLEVLREARRQQSERHRAIAGELERHRTDRGGLERELAVGREHLQRAQVADAETKLRLESLTETLRSEFDCEAEVAMAAESPELPDGTTAAARIRELERELRLMGPINPLALEEFQALQERHEFLQGQLEDIRHTRRELTKIIRAVDEEIVSVFSAAFADVSDNFTKLFDTLFPGGQGRLRLTDPQNLLETGIELEARPSGKNVKKLSLLSGGERSLTALAYLFAVFRSRPSPFYVMDEVEAALDDINLHRFLELVAEFRSSAQLIIVSHQKRTMEAADVLYGVTMEPGGSTKVLSERVATVLD